MNLACHSALELGKQSGAAFVGRHRLVQFLYTQLPYHPERIEAATAWTVELAQPLELTLKKDPPGSGNNLAIHDDNKAKGREKLDPTTSRNQETVWRLRAYLQKTISSANEKRGDTFQALVAEPAVAHRRWRGQSPAATYSAGIAPPAGRP
jgi:hypothetical protein